MHFNLCITRINVYFYAAYEENLPILFVFNL